MSTPKPDGAFDGRSFTVTGAMTSLTGASGEDFASILRSLGLNHEKLTYNFQGRDFRLTDVFAKVVNEVLA